MDLLCRQKRGKFGLIWLAATRGITTIKRKEVDAVNITHTWYVMYVLKKIFGLYIFYYFSNELLKYIMSQSTIPKKRLSLYLSAKLIFGTVLIYKQQVVHFERKFARLIILWYGIIILYVLQKRLLHFFVPLKDL